MLLKSKIINSLSFVNFPGNLENQGRKMAFETGLSYIQLKTANDSRMAVSANVGKIKRCVDLFNLIVIHGFIIVIVI